MPLLPTAEGHLEYVVTGVGSPTTVFAHGLAGAIAQTRPLGSGVHGTRVFLHFRGHGASSAPESPWTYPALADELRLISDHTDAGRAVGVSLGAGALTRLLADTPDRFERLVFFLPAVLDRPRQDAALARLEQMADYVDHRDIAGIEALLLAEQPVGVRTRPDVAHFVAQQARVLAGTSVSRALRELPYEVPISDRTRLHSVIAPALVIGQEGDDAHPLWVAEELADALPDSRLHVFDDDGALWSHRGALRELIAGFLNS